jgi:hypothetical protein
MCVVCGGTNRNYERPNGLDCHQSTTNKAQPSLLFLDDNDLAFTSLDEILLGTVDHHSAADDGGGVYVQQISWPLPIDVATAWSAAMTMANRLDQLADLLERNSTNISHHSAAQFNGGVSFWDGDRYVRALRLFGSVLRSPDSPSFVDRADENVLIQHGSTPYTHVIKNPLCFRDIVAALVGKKKKKNESSDTYDNDDDDDYDDDVAPNMSLPPEAKCGKLPARGLANWNMWRGLDLLQAIDLVMLNSLAYGRAIEHCCDGGGGKSNHRSLTNKLRKILWNGISGIVSLHAGRDLEKRRQCTPIKRSENSGFVVYKIKEG